MVTKEHIRKLAQSHISGTTGIFLVDVRLSSTGRITVLIDRNEGVTIDDCAALSRFLSNEMGEEAGDFELSVSSPGLDMPLLVFEQYKKNEGREVEVTGADNNRTSGIMRNVTSGGFDLEVSIKQKGQQPGIKTLSFNYEDVKAVKVKISFK